MTNLNPTRSLRVRAGTEDGQPTLVLQMLKIPNHGHSNQTYALSDTRWEDATIEDLSTIANIQLGLAPSPVIYS